MSSRLVSATATTSAPAEVAFDIVADPRQHSRVDGSGTVRDTVTGPDRLAAGARFTMNMRMGVPYRITSTVVEFEEGRRIAWRHPGGHVWRYEFEPEGEGEGTRITETFDYSAVSGIQARLYELVRIPARNRRGIEQTVLRLAAAAEEDALRR